MPDRITPRGVLPARRPVLAYANRRCLQFESVHLPGGAHLFARPMSNSSATPLRLPSGGNLPDKWIFKTQLIIFPSSRMWTAPLASTVSQLFARKTSVNVPMGSTSDPKISAVAFCLVSEDLKETFNYHVFLTFLDSRVDAGDICTINADCQGLGPNHRCRNFKCEYTEESDSEAKQRTLGVQTSIDVVPSHSSVGVNTSIDVPESAQDEDAAKCEPIQMILR